MRRCFIILFIFSVSFCFITESFAQSTKPKDMVEVGLQGGTFLIAGDFPISPGFGGGIHIRKSLDYLFSIRVDGFYGKITGDKMLIDGINNGEMRSYETKWMGASLLGVMSLNGLRWDKPVRSSNFYFMLGAGVNNFSVEYLTEAALGRNTKFVDPAFAPHLTIGTGLSFRLSQKLNVGIESQANIVFGSRADIIDGIDFKEDLMDITTFRDILGFIGISLNYNLGSPGNSSEPLYWVNPLDNVMKDIKQLKERPEVSLEDSDGDGVIDALDKEPNTPADAIVDVKGRTLDSDRDGVPDHLDKEPFYTPRENEEVNNEGVAINSITREPLSFGSSSGAGGITEARVKELIQQALQSNSSFSSDGRTNAAEWFLPMLHFSSDSYRVKYADYGHLASIARTMQSNPNLRLVVIGFTDATGNETINNNLSYQRAKAVIEHLETLHGVSRSRLVLQWKGSDDSLVPSNSSYMNRRVEFRVAGPGDFEMEPPASSSDGY